MPGPMAIVRFGSCGVVHEDLDVGQIIVPESAIMIQQNFFGITPDPFLISKPCSGCRALNEEVATELKANSCSSQLYQVPTGGIDASSDSFYASQGRPSGCFDQDTKWLFPKIQELYPKHHIFEMEAYYLYKLGEMSTKEKKIYAGCACIGLFHRTKHHIIESHKVRILEIIGGKSLLDAITKFTFPETEPENTTRLRTLLGGK